MFDCVIYGNYVEGYIGITKSYVVCLVSKSVQYFVLLILKGSYMCDYRVLRLWPIVSRKRFYMKNFTGSERVKINHMLSRRMLRTVKKGPIVRRLVLLWTVTRRT